MGMPPERPVGPSAPGPARYLAPRLARLPVADIEGRAIRIADRWWARALGLALLDSREAASGLLIPGCRSVHTFGMRFPLDIAFLDAEGAVLSRRLGVPPRRVVFNRRAAAVLELPSARDREVAT
ncbi:MAG TPA: DUF192 domain-containing protein [Candidatus Limnocylindria bacterium]|nr:DUF192 domain-containing protein [Candidatus Limnocylindria bacterium]